MFTINSDSGGGVEHLANTLREDIERLRATVDTVFLYPSPNASTAEKLLGIARVAWRIVVNRPDMLITFQPTSSVISMVVGRTVGVCARIVHQSNLPMLTNPLARWVDLWAGALGFYSTTIMNSESTEATFSDYPRIYRERFKHIPHGVFWAPPSKSRRAVRAELELPQDVPVLLTCARLSQQKSLQTILNLLPELSDTYFVLAGEGEYENELKRLTKALGVSNRTRFVGRVDHRDLFDLHGAADLFVFPSRWETFGIAAVEAAMSGLPIVSSDIPPTREILTINGRSPLIFVPNWDHEHWIRAIRNALTDPQFKISAESFRSVIRETYSVESMLKTYRILYDEVLP